MLTHVLEDQFNDILLKAWRGSGLSREAVCLAAGVTAADFSGLLGGQLDAIGLSKIARVLGLDCESLLAIARDEYNPCVAAPEFLLVCASTYRGFVVNAYLIWDHATGEAVAFDTGADAQPMLTALEERQLRLTHIALTHTHGDHVGQLAALQAVTGASAYVSEAEPLTGAVPIAAGHRFSCGSMEIVAHRTSGHTVGGLSYVVSGRSPRVVVVGDALFAGSIGGGLHDYHTALRDNRDVIFGLEDGVVIAPGHGPLTTVGLERHHNPFFAGSW